MAYAGERIEFGMDVFDGENAVIEKAEVWSRGREEPEVSYEFRVRLP